MIRSGQLSTKDAWFAFCVSFGVVFMCFFVPSFQGIDLTDAGFHLTNQITAVESPPHHPVTMIFLTDYIGGLWLKLSPCGPWLWWARLGGNLLAGCSAGVCSLTLLSWAGRWKLASFATIVGFLSCAGRYPKIFHYDTFPAFLFFLWFFLLVRAIEASGTRRTIYLFLLGALNGVMVFARFPLVLLLLIAPATYPCWAWLHKRPLTMRPLLKKGVSWCAGVLVACVVLGGMYKMLGVEWHQGRQDGATDVLANLQIYGLSLLADFAITALVVVVGACALLMLQQWNRTLMWGGVVAGILGFLGLLLLVCQKMRWGPTPGDVAQIAYFDVSRQSAHFAVGSLLLLLLFSFRPLAGARQRLFEWLVIQFALAVPLGTKAGCVKLAYVCPVVIGYLVVMGVQHKFLSWKRYPWAMILAAMFPIWGLLGLCAATYRDAPRYLLTTSAAAPSLKWIHSTPDRVRVMDQLLEEMRVHSTRGEEVLAINGPSLLYYLTDTRPWIAWPWPSAYEPDRFQNVFHDTLAEKSYPRLIVAARKDTRDFGWPNTDRLFYTENYRQNHLFMEPILEEHYHTIFQNEMFSLHAISDVKQPSKTEPPQ